MKRFCLALILLVLAAWPAHAQPVTVIGPITAGNCTAFFSTTQIQDAGVTCGAVSGITVGTTTISGGTPNGLLYNNAGVLGNLATGNNGILATNSSGVPSIATALPAGLTIPSTAIDTLCSTTNDLFQRVSGTWQCGPQFLTGTWTPAIVAATPGDLSVVFSFNNAQWMRIGNFVYVSCDVVTSTFTHTTASGQMTVTGMPYNANDDFVGPLDFQGINKTGGYTAIHAVTSASAKTVAFEANGMNLSIASIQITDMPSAGTVVLRFSIWYQTNDP